MENRRRITFELPPAIISEFCEELSSTDLENEIMGVTDTGEIIVEVYYDKNESDAVDDLEKFFDELSENMENMENDEIEDENEDEQTQTHQEEQEQEEKPLKTKRKYR
jgi:thiamine biosynthesis lipoprotein ApbE